MEENKKLTPAEVAEKDQKKAERRAMKKAGKEAKNKAFDAIKAYSDKNPAIKELSDALKVIRPSLYGIVKERTGGLGVTPNFTKFVALVAEKKSISEDEVFKQFKIGRKDAAGFIRKALKRAEPENRLWINFDKEKGTYLFVGKGVTAPANYNGPRPSEEKVDLM